MIITRVSYEPAWRNRKSMNLTISLAQMHILTAQPEANFAQAGDYAQQAARGGSGLLLLPELWTTGYDLINARRHAVTNRALLPRISALAAENNITIAGSMLLEDGAGIANTLVFQPPAGTPPSLYSKIHLFRLMEEDRWLTPGKSLQQAGPQWGEAGLAICYDLRFPEMFRRYALAGARLFLISAEWPEARTQHWQTLLRARAIENQCYAAAVNCTGETAGEIFGGRSALISPWGETVIEGSSSQPELLTAVIDLEAAETARRKIPILNDRRPDIYG